MSREGYPHVISAFSTALVAASSTVPLSRGPYSVQATVVTTSTGASAVIAGTVVVSATLDETNFGYSPVGTLTLSGSGTARAVLDVANNAYRQAKLEITTLTTGIAAELNCGIGS